MNTPKMILMDLDDTLLYTIQTGFHRVNYSLEHMNYKKLTFQDFLSVYGVIPFPECIYEWVSRDDYMMFLEYYESSKDSVVYKPIVSMELMTLVKKQLNTSFGIVTNTPGYKLSKKLSEVAYPESFFKVIKCDAKKPNPSEMRATIKLIEIDNENIIYVGDHLVDLEVSEKVGLTFFAVTTGKHSHEDFLKKGLPPENIFNNIKDLFLKLLKNEDDKRDG